MPHSPLGMPDHSAMLAAAQMNALNSSALSGMLNAARPPFSTSQGMPFGVGNPLGGKSSPIGRGTPSSDGGSGSAGNGPTIQVIDVKLEEVRHSITNCFEDALKLRPRKLSEGDSFFQNARILSFRDSQMTDRRIEILIRCSMQMFEIAAAESHLLRSASPRAASRASNSPDRLELLLVARFPILIKM